MISDKVLIEHNAERWTHMHLHAHTITAFDAVAKRLVAPAAKTRYLAVEKETGVPWWVIAVIHEREGSQNFNTYLGNGQSLRIRTTIEPKGRGPFMGPNAFFNGCIDALVHCGPYASRWRDWTPGGSLTILEKYNGEGYDERGDPSPYVFAGSDQYSHGKFIADHKFSETAVDTQLGCAPLLVRMMAMDAGIKFAAAPGPWVSVKETAQPVAEHPKPAPEAHETFVEKVVDEIKRII